MEPTPERIELYYTVRYLDPIDKRRVKTRWKMTEEDAAKLYTDREYEILWNTKEERRVGGDPLRNSMSRFQAAKK